MLSASNHDVYHLASTVSASSVVRFDSPEKRFPKWENPTFDEMGKTKWGWMCQKLVLGKHVDIGVYTYINAKFGVVMEDLVQVGSHCSIYSISAIDNKKGKITLRRNAR